MSGFDFNSSDSSGSRLGVIAASAGSAVGLGNIRRFPYIPGKKELSNGGLLKTRYYHLYRFVIKFITPIAIALMFLNGIGIIKL